MRRHCDICGKPMRKYEVNGKTVWKCMTSPADHKKIFDSLEKSRGGKPRKGKFAGRPWRKPKPKTN